MGFEVELPVPTTRAPDDGTRARVLKSFLGGGLPYATDLGENNHFSLKSDHNDLGRLHRNLLAGIDRARMRRPDFYEDMSNLEYVTRPVDELRAGSTTAIRQKLNAIAVHATALFPRVQNEYFRIPAPSGNFYTGIPINELRMMYGNAIDPQI